MQPACVLCDSNENDEVIFGEMHTHERNTMHRNCLVLCLGKYIRRNAFNRNVIFRLANFLKKEVLVQKKRFSSMKCTYCNHLGANLPCAHERCQRRFHTKCGVKNMAVLQYGGRFDSFCAQHVPLRRNRPGQDETCVLCLGPVVPEDKAFSPAMAFQAPCCHNGWFHRECVQDQSNSTTYYFKCPLCRNDSRYGDVALFGVSIPKWRYTLPKPVVMRFNRNRPRNVITGRYIGQGPGDGIA